MCEGLVFTARYSRKIQPWNYEYIMISHEEQFHVGEVSREEGHRVVRDIVETLIDVRLQELYSEEKQRQRR